MADAATPTGGDPKDETPALLFDHNVIEHLGIKLYQNRPGNVLAELVSNSWDADSKHVWVSIGDATEQSPAFIAVADDGSGMSLADIKSKYLVVGQPKRGRPNERSTELKRKPMGRKGIGKLAPFGIARRIDVVSLQGGLVNWFTLELEGLKAVSNDKRYEPIFPISNKPLGEIVLEDAEPRSRGVKWFLEQVRETGRGTLILLSDLTANRVPARQEVVGWMGARFTVVLARADFQVSVNGYLIEASEAIPEFDLKIPAEGAFASDTVGGREVRYWAGFFKTAERTTDEAGVGVFAHGKIAQDRPFFFYATGKEVFQRYLYAVVEADWIDDLPDDLISTDRTSINWEHPEAEALAEWGKGKVREWLNAYDRHRKGMSKTETSATARRLREQRRILSFSRIENEAIDELVADATTQVPKAQAEKAREDLLEAVTKAWANQPVRELIKKIWDGFAKAEDTSLAFEKTLTSLYDSSVPEAMGLAMTFAQRAYALTVLTKLIHERSETNLQDLIEEFPWIVDPHGSLLTADQTMKTTVNRLADSYAGDNSYDSLAQIKLINERQRADFVFLSAADKKIIRIVELKAPAGDTLQRYHETQLIAYINQVRSVYNTAVVTGILIGNRGASNAFDAEHTLVTVKSWDQILAECRAVYVDMLAAMMTRADLDTGDGRVVLIREFAGREVWELLERIAREDEGLRKVMQRLEHLTKPKTGEAPTPPPSAAQR